MSKSDSSHSSQTYKRFSSIGNWNKKKIIQKLDIICFTNGKKHRDSVSVDPAFRLLDAFPTRMTSSIFLFWKKIDFYWLFENDLESPLIFVLFLKGKQNKKEKP